MTSVRRGGSKEEPHQVTARLRPETPPQHIVDNRRSCAVRPEYLPRLVDSTTLPDVTFRAWVSGIASVFPHRKAAQVGDQFIEDHQPGTMRRRGEAGMS